MSRARIAIALLTFSAAAFVHLAVSENYVEVATVPVKGDVPTNGFGSTRQLDGSPVKLGDRTTPVAALQRSLAYMQTAEVSFRRCVDVPLHQAEFDLYLDFAYQYGMPTLCASPIVGHLRALRYDQACDALLEFRFMTSPIEHDGWEVSRRDSAGRPTRWKFDCATPGNKVCAGVWTRQQRRHQQCKAAQ
ncbi:lysozyme [Mitsuaria sp. GD03876]|uniref:glycoside hydrolase family protein n=1 Tax=Mitsuaria sp. GD03876 TaxID=2975399 RepID=UPI00244B2D08|nr:lysozyme [Mitsuaria sp. GD03876]MDH0866446.1 lysozyme [Mitsuaria sp. GD03876]